MVHLTRDSSPTNVTLVVKDKGGEKDISPSSAPPHSRQESGPAFSCSHSSVPQLPRSALLCCPGKVQGQLFCSHDPSRCQGQSGGECITHSHQHGHHMEQNRSWACYPVIPSAHYTTHSTGLSLLSCPGKVQGQLSRVLQLVRGRDSSLACYRCQGARVGEGTSPLPHSHICRANSPTLISSGPAHLHPIIRVTSAVLPRSIEGPALPGAAAREGQGQLSCSHVSRAPAAGDEW